MSMSREEQLKILGQMKDSDIDYSDIAATDAEFWQEATVNSPLKVPVTLQLDPSVVASRYIKVWRRNGSYSTAMPLNLKSVGTQTLSKKSNWNPSYRLPPVGSLRVRRSN